MLSRKAPQRHAVGRPVASDGAAARERLLDATLSLIADQGVAATSIAQIAKHAGVTPAMVHYYFKNRELLFDAVVDERLAPVIANVWNPVQQSADPFDAVEGIVRRIAEAARNVPQIPALWLREVISDGGQLRQRVLPRLPSDKLQVLNALIAQGQREGRINPRLDARYMFMSVVGLTMMPLAVSSVFVHITGQAIDVDALVEHVVSLLRHGMDTPHASTRRS
ncbi:TetR/AcrR family transcriptional regulator [Uliginosibacterium sp. sgz301328]|uniref:TetR/AcrR family transcriptional regulator n=1 Tax=Uliginosibacterium sp. sgz301328 TaxID=3243764 RepID=UPI00359D8940